MIRLVFELAYFEAAVQHFGYYAVCVCVCVCVCARVYILVYMSVCTNYNMTRVRKFGGRRKLFSK